MGDIETQAARWVVRRNGASADALPDADFLEWYHADAAHAQHYDGLADLWRNMGHVDGERVREGVRQGLRRRKRRARVVTVLSCCLAAGVLIAWQAQAWLHWRADVVTAAGEIRSVTLPDGSQVVLDALSALRSDMRGDTRTVVLLRGRALFNVAHDASRPFIVETPQARATALGTRYEVSRLRDGATDVSVLENLVRVDCTVCPADTPGRVLAASQRAAVSPAGIAVDAVDPDAAAVWTQRKLLLRDVPLADAVAQLDRYTGMTTWVGRAVGEKRISTLVNVDSPDALDVLAAAVGLRVRRWGTWAWIDVPD